MTTGDRGRIVVSAELRRRLHLEPGVPLVLMEAPSGLVVLKRDQLKDLADDAG